MRGRAASKNYKLAIKRGLPIEELDHVIRLLTRNDELPHQYRDHLLTGNWVGHRECHIRPDWLLICKIDNDLLLFTLTRTGSHSDLLDM